MRPHASRSTWSRVTRAPSQYPKRRLSVRSRKVSKPRNLYLELSDRSEIWQALRQQCCRCACQISKRYNNLKYQSRGFETSRDLTKRRLFVYWDRAQGDMDWCRGGNWVNFSCGKRSFHCENTRRFNECQHPKSANVFYMYLPLYDVEVLWTIFWCTAHKPWTHQTPGTKPRPTHAAKAETADVIRFSSSSMWEHTGVVGNTACLACRIKTIKNSGKKSIETQNKTILAPRYFR